MNSLSLLGFTEFFSQQLTSTNEDASLHPGRVAQQQRKSYLVLTEDGSRWCDLAGRFFHQAEGRMDFPAVGDWVMYRPRPHEDRGIIHRLLERQNVLARPETEAGRAGDGEQILAANLDVAFLVSSLNRNMERGGLRRLERYLAMAHGAGVAPVILLTKSDLVAPAELPAMVAEVQSIAPQAPVHAVSCLNSTGIETVASYLTAGKTGVLLGSSGVGKSTLVNHLAQADIQDMMEAREFDDKGRHCTTFRNLIRLPADAAGSPRGMIIDTPGLRGLTLGDDNAGVGLTFEDIDELARRCRFTDCRHASEPGCALRAAVEAGGLDADRLESYLKLTREVAAMERRNDPATRQRDKRRSKQINAYLRQKERDRWS